MNTPKPSNTTTRSRPRRRGGIRARLRRYKTEPIYYLPTGLLDDEEEPHYYLPTGLLDDEEEPHYYLPTGLLDDECTDVEMEFCYNDEEICEEICTISLNPCAQTFIPFIEKLRHASVNAREFIPN
jgi:hypothetical protein